MQSPLSVKLARRSLLATGAVGVASASTIALDALSQVSPGPLLGAPDAATRATLRSLAESGAVVLVDDMDAGPRAKVTVLCKVPAPIAEVRSVIATPERYGDFMTVLRDVSVQSRRGTSVGFRFHAVASIFDLETNAALRVVNGRRIDVAIVRSDLGPGAARWDLFEDADGGTLVCCSSWGDPSQGHWLFRQIASRGGAAVSMMTAAVSLLLTLSLVRRLRRTAVAPTPPNNVPLAPLPEYARALVGSSRGAIGAVTLAPNGAVIQASACIGASGTIHDFDRWISDPARYSQVWRSLRNVRVESRSAEGVRYWSEIEASVARSSGARMLTMQREGRSVSARWIGLSGDERGHEQRWDAAPLPAGRVAVCATVRDEVSRVGFPLRSTLDREPALRAGFAFGLSVVWARSLARRLDRDAAERTPTIDYNSADAGRTTNAEGGPAG